MYPFYVIHQSGSGTNTNWLWRPNLNNTYDGRFGLSINASINVGLTSGISIRQVIPDDKLIIIYAGSNNGSLNIPGRVVAINLKQGQVGTELYSYNFTSPQGIGDAYGQLEQFSNKDVAFNGINAQAGIFWYQNPMTLTTYVYDLSNGNQLYTTKAPEFSFYGMGTKIVYNNMLIDCGGYGGIVQAFDVKTGEFLWNWSAPSVGLGETPYQNSPTSYGALSGDGLLYLYSSEHSNNNPIRRDAQIWAINVTNGEMAWMLTCWPSTAPILADGRLVVVDCHDLQVYCYGKGPSGTTVTASPEVSGFGNSVMIKGTITDQSPSGRRDINGNIDLALKGTPAISDEDMDAWMEYLFHKRPMPEDAKGVEVSLITIDPNGNQIDIGTTTSDNAGNYALSFIPEVPGTYQIIASFAGSKSYGPSFGTTYLLVEDETPTTPAPSAQPESIADMYFVPATAGIIIAIVIVGAILALLLLRKRP
jgi:hypothetical protein